MNEETYKPVPFNGIPEKIVIESENGGFCPPAPGQEMMQRLTLRRNGKVFFTRYFSGDYSKVPPTADTKTMNRYNGKLTVKLMERIAQCFREPCIHEFWPDAGIWRIKLVNTEGMCFEYVGSFGNDLVLNSVNISSEVRKILEINDLWMFKGGEDDE